MSSPHYLSPHKNASILGMITLFQVRTLRLEVMIKVKELVSSGAGI